MVYNWCDEIEWDFFGIEPNVHPPLPLSPAQKARTDAALCRCRDVPPNITNSLLWQQDRTLWLASSPRSLPHKRRCSNLSNYKHRPDISSTSLTMLPRKIRTLPHRIARTKRMLHAAEGFLWIAGVPSRSGRRTTNPYAFSCSVLCLPFVVNLATR